MRKLMLALSLIMTCLGLQAQTSTAFFTPDTITLLRNPMQGWVIYAGLGDGLADDFWNRYDNLASSEGPVNVSNYATTLFIRGAWSDFNPQEGVYVWQPDCNTRPAQRFRMLTEGAKARKLKLAFSFITDSRDKHYQFTPAYVRNAGASGFMSTTGSVTVWSPYPDDTVFQAKFKAFLTAFAHNFNDPSTVQFISGTGLGKWGESHSLRYSTGDERPRVNVFNWITDLMAGLFTKVPVIINYHRWILTGHDWDGDNIDPLSGTLLNAAVDKGFSLRHDAFGMHSYYRQWEKKYANDHLYQRPIIAEGGWVQASHSLSAIQADEYNNFAEVRQGEFDDARDAHANMMDFRYNSNIDISETASWFTTHFDLVKTFISRGGYRLYPSSVTVPTKVINGTTITFNSTWCNVAWGYCPTNLPQWNQKYKVAYALLDAEDNVVKHFVDTSTDLSQWRQGKPTNYVTTISFNGVKAGNYRWAVGLVDTTQQNRIGLLMAVDKKLQVGDGWLPVGQVEVANNPKVVKILAIGNSFSQDAVEQYLHELANNAGITTIIGNMFIGGCTLETHQANAIGNVSAYSYRKIGTNGIKFTTDNVSLESALADEEWDYVSLQQASGLSGLYDTYTPCLPSLVSYVRQRVPSAKMVWHQTWAYAQNSSHSAFANYGKDQFIMYHAIVNAARKAFVDNHFDILVPSGTAIQNARTTFLGDNMTRDGYHLQLSYGRYTAACTWFEALFGNVIGNTSVPAGLGEASRLAAQMSAHKAVISPDETTDLSYITAQDAGQYFFVRPDDDPNIVPGGNGESWEKAISFSDFCTRIESLADGDQVYFAGGTYRPSVPLKLTHSLCLYGGFNPLSTGNDTTLPCYPSHTPTVFNGDVNKDGTTGEGDLSQILVIDLSGGSGPGLPAVIQGIDFTGAYVASAGSTTDLGALHVKDCQNLTIKNCKFYGNTSTGHGGIAFRSEYSTTNVTDCVFACNQAASRGGAVRLSSNDKGKGLTTFDRCLFVDNAVSDAVGSAICLQHGIALRLINTTLTANKSASGGAIYANGANADYKRELYVFNSTISGNTGGPQIEMTQGARLYLANSIITGQGSDAAISITGTSVSPYYDIKSYGFNIFGTYVDQASNVPEWTNSDKLDKDFLSVFGTTSVSEDGMLLPLETNGKALLADLSDIATYWQLASNVSVDQKGYPRANYDMPGAIARGTLAGVASMPERSTNSAHDSLYTITGIRVTRAPGPGIYILNGKKIIVK